MEPRLTDQEFRDLLDVYEHIVTAHTVPSALIQPCKRMCDLLNNEAEARGWESGWYGCYVNFKVQT